MEKIKLKETSKYSSREINMNDTIVLNFHGSYKFTKSNNYLFDSEFVKNEGI